MGTLDQETSCEKDGPVFPPPLSRSLFLAFLFGDAKARVGGACGKCDSMGIGRGGLLETKPDGGETKLVQGDFGAGDTGAKGGREVVETVTRRVGGWARTLLRPGGGWWEPLGPLGHSELEPYELRAKACGRLGRAQGTLRMRRDGGFHRHARNASSSVEASGRCPVCVIGGFRLLWCSLLSLGPSSVWTCRGVA